MPAAVPAATAMVMLVLPPAEMGLVVNPVVMLAEPDVESVMDPENPPVIALEIEVEPLLPALTVTELGEAEMVKPA